VGSGSVLLAQYSSAWSSNVKDVKKDTFKSTFDFPHRIIFSCVDMEEHVNYSLYNNGL